MGSLSLFFSLLAAAALAVTYVDRVYISRVLAHYKVNNLQIFIFYHYYNDLLDFSCQLNHYHEEAFSSRGSVFNAVHEVLDEFKEEDDHFPPADDQEVHELELFNGLCFVFSTLGIYLRSRT